MYGITYTDSKYLNFSFSTPPVRHSILYSNSLDFKGRSSNATCTCYIWKNTFKFADVEDVMHYYIYMYMKKSWFTRIKIVDRILILS